MTPAHALSTFLPPVYRMRLVLAASVRDHLEIDEITDELARQYPEKVRPRTDVGRFASVAEERRGAGA